MTESICPVCGEDAIRNPSGEDRTGHCAHCCVYLGRYFLTLESLGKAGKKYSRWKARGARAADWLLEPVFVVGLVGSVAALVVVVIQGFAALADFFKAPIGIKGSPDYSGWWVLPIMLGFLVLLAVPDWVGSKLEKFIPQWECPACYFHSRDRAELRTHAENEHKWSPEAVSGWMEKLEVSIFGAG